MNKLLLLLIIALPAATAATAQETADADSLTRMLQDVVVTARQPATRLVGSTLVSTIQGSDLSGLGTALDVLSQLPMFRVDDDAVSVIGKENIEIYIDGRPMRDNSELSQLMSADMKKVELIMAPGAVYKSTTGAVVRITTRKRRIEGLSMTDRAQLTQRRKWSAADYLSLSYRAGNWEMFLEGTVNRNNSLAKGTTVNTLTLNGHKTVVGGSQHNSYSTTSGIVKAGINYSEGAQSAGAYYRYSPEQGHFNNSGSEWLDNEPPLDREIDKRNRDGNHLVSAYYENRFSDKYLLHFDGDFRLSTGHNDVTTAYPESTMPAVASTEARKSTLWAGKLYVEFPLWRGDFTAGTQNSYTNTSLRYVMHNDLVGEYIPSSLADTRQTSAALFASWSKVINSFNLSAGARYEYVDYDFIADGKRDGDVSHRDHLLTPDISLGYSFKNGGRLNLSYKMATVKPPYSRLTGALNYVGRHEIEGGNPLLRDEHMHDIRLLGMWRGFFIQADFTRSFDTYAFVKELYRTDNLQLLMHPVNIDVSALSLQLVWSKPVGRWTPNVTAGMYRQWLTLDRTTYNKPIFSYYFDNTFSLPYEWMITANFSGNTRGDMHTNRFGATRLAMDASISKAFLNRSLTVKLSATDIFNTANNNWTMMTDGIFVDKRQSYDHRGIALSVIYSIRPRKNSYKGQTASEAEMNRL